jgi:hypothetical protein
VLRDVAPYADLRDRWTLPEMAEAHMALDVSEDLETILHADR